MTTLNKDYYYIIEYTLYSIPFSQHILCLQNSSSNLKLLDYILAALELGGN